MNKDQVISGLYNYLVTNLPQAALKLIILNDIRVENFFAIHSGVYLDKLLTEGQISNFSFQHTILLNNPNRVHIDIAFTDSNNSLTFLELKHFSISCNRGNGRSLSFYTSNSFEGKKVGIIGDCEKLDKLRNKGYINSDTNLICCAFISQKPNLYDINQMKIKFEKIPELAGWNLVFPVLFDEQVNSLGLMTLQK